MEKFINERKDNWERLEELLDLVRGSSLRRLSRAEVRELGELYRRAAADLAIARAETRDPKVVNYLNSLVIRAHGRIYRAESNGAAVVWRFFAHELPNTFRDNLWYMVIAFGTFAVFSVAAFYLCLFSPEFSDHLGLEQAAVFAKEDHRWWLELNSANEVGSSAILTNNILVALRAFAFGALLGVGTFYVLAFNGLHIGGVLGVCWRENTPFAYELLKFMVGHGVVELSCIFMAGGAGMMIGYAIVNPGNLTRAQALKKKGMEAARIVVGCAVFLFFAGIIEGFLSPSPLPAWIKIATGVSTGVALYCYLFLVGREPLNPH